MNPIGEWTQKGQLRSWFERIEVIFLDEEIDEAADAKRALKVLKWIGEVGYEKLKRLCAPKLPREMKYAELKKLLLDNVDPEPTTLAQRFSFSRLQQGNRSVSDWEALLKFHAAKCAYGDHYDDAVRDQFVFGLACSDTRLKLMEMEKLTLKDAFAKAEARERAERDNHMISKSGSGGNTKDVHKLSNRRNNPSSYSSHSPQSTGGHSRSGGRSSSSSTTGSGNSRSGSGGFKSGKKGNDSRVCVRCKLDLKSNRCTEQQCKTRCFVCKKIGHTKSQCFKIVNKSYQLDAENEYSSVDCNCETPSMNYIDVNKIASGTDKVFVRVHIESKCVKFEFDTGSALTVISKSEFNKLFPGLKLKPARQVLKVANGATLDKVQVCDVDISCGQSRHHQVRLYVAEDPFPALLGRDWIALIWGKDWACSFLDKERSYCNTVAGNRVASIDVKVPGSGVNVENRATVKVPGSGVNVENRATEGLPCKEVQVSDKTAEQVSVPEREYVYRLNQDKGDVTHSLTCNTDDTECDRSFDNKESRETRLAKLYQSKVFKPGVGEVVGYEAQLQLKEDSKPVFRKARTVPYALKEKIEETIDQMVEDKILTPVDHSQFASPIVPVIKPDSSVRICGDYKSTLNPNLETKQYPLPTVDECFHPMRGGVQFSKLDIRQAYNHLRLRQEDKLLTTINTTKGLYIWNRLPYGVSSATAIFQQTMDDALRGCKGTVCRVDDILVTGETEEEHLQNLEEVIGRLEKAQFRCNLSKSKFLQDEIKYLGYVINKEGIRPCRDKVETLLKADYPESLPALVSFLSACQYYGRFIKNLSTIVEPLNRLRRGVPWKFEKEEKEAFDSLKKALTSSAVIVPYNPKLPVKIDTDASATGLGAVISHIMDDGSERPIEFASRTLSSSERNYSQIEKEALSLVWGVTKFHKFVYARKFTLVTDHKPLLYILKENKAIPDMATSRIVRWANTLACYQYKIQYRPTGEHSNADVCSRYPLKNESEEEDEVADVFFNTFAEIPVINFNSISKLTQVDTVLSKVRKYVLEGWPTRLTQEQDYLKPYFERRTELSTEKGCVLWGSRIVVPTVLRKDVLDLLHIAHQGVVAVKALARSYVWWPRINEEIENVIQLCQACQNSQNRPARSKPHPWKPATKPWERIHADFCGPVHGSMWLIVVDAYSKWIEAINMKSSTTSASTIRELRKLFAVHGLPTIFCSDNAQQLRSEEITQFLQSNGIQAVPVPTYSPNTNGIAERAVQSFKKAMKKAARVSSDYEKNLATWLLHYRNTPNSVTKQTPAMMMFNRPTRTLLSLLDPLTNSKEDILESNPYNKEGKERLRSFQIGEQVRVLNVRSNQWYTGTVIGKEGCKVYMVKSQSGTIERRHLDHLVRAVDLSDSPDLIDTRETDVTREPLHNPIVNQHEHNQAVPNRNTNSEHQSIQIPQSSVQSPVQLTPKHPVIQLTKSNPANITTSGATRVVPQAPTPNLNSSAPNRVSNRQRSKVEKLCYSRLGGN